MTDLGSVVLEALQKIASNGLVTHFTALEFQHHANLVTARQKLLCLIELGLIVVGINAAGELNLLDLNDLLLLLGFLFTLLLFKQILTVVHDLAHRGICLCSDQNQIHVFLISQFLSLSGTHNAQGLTVCADHSNLGEVNCLVDRGLSFLSIVCDRYTPPK